MSERTTYTPGTFSWADLQTTDQEGAKAFYSALFGWEANDMPIDDSGTTYSMQKLGGKNVAAIAPQQQQQRDMGVPPAWNNYVTVESADDAASRAAELGATVHAPAFDVFDAGRMAVIQDPQGAFFMVWQAKQHIGAQLVNAPGALCWNELASSDLDASAKFYGDLFGWKAEPFEASPQPYLIIQNDGRGNGGIVGLPDPNMPPFWLPYFATDDLDGALAKVDELGGKKHVGPMELPMAKIAIVADPQGATFALYDGELQA